MRIVAAVLAGLAGVWLAADLAFSRVTAARLRRWEAGIQRDADGVRTGCRERTLGDGPTALLFIHGFGDSPDLWRRMAPALAEKGFTCRLMRLPGFAEPMARYERTSRDKWTRAVEEELAALRRTHENVFIVAHSLGAACAVNVLIRDPDAADGLAALAPLIGVSNARSPVLSARTWFRLADRLTVFSTVIPSAFAPDVRDPDEARRMKTDAFVPRAVFRSLFSLIAENQRRAQEFRTPLLMVLAKEDPVIDVRAAEAFLRAVPARPKRLAHAPASGHVIPVDRDWEQVAQEVERFVREQIAAQGQTQRHEDAETQGRGETTTRHRAAT